MNEKVHLRGAVLQETPRASRGSLSSSHKLGGGSNEFLTSLTPPAKMLDAPPSYMGGQSSARGTLTGGHRSVRVIQADPFEETCLTTGVTRPGDTTSSLLIPTSRPATLTPTATHLKSPPSNLTPTSTPSNDSNSWIRKMLGESREITQTRNFRKWRSMKARNFSTFYRDHPSTFLRRMRRGVPQKYRWEVWKVVTGLDDVLQSSNAECILQYIPMESAPSHTTSSDAGDSFKQSDEPHSSNGSAPVVDGSMTRAEIEALAPNVTAAELFKILSSKPSKYASLIDIDLNRTFPEIAMFDAKVQRSLHSILNAYANLAPHVGYCQGMNFVMGFILLVSNFAPDIETFWFFVIMMSKYHLHGFFREGFPLLSVYISTFDELGEYYAPELRQHFSQESVLPPVYLHQWYLTLFVTSLPLGTVVVLWDCILCNGLSAILPLTVALLKVLQSFLLRLRFEGIVKFLKSLRLSGDCDEGKIGKMLVKHADNYPLPPKYIPIVVDIDVAKLLSQTSRDGGAVKKASLVDFRSMLEEDNNLGTELNPLNAAMQDQGFTGDEDDEEDSCVPDKSSKEVTNVLTDDDTTKRMKHGPDHHPPPPNGGRGSLGGRFLPKVIGRKN